MKSYVDFFATLSGELRAKLQLASKLRKHWGVTTIDGIEVYKSSFMIWPGTEQESVKKVLKIFGIPIAEIKKSSKKGLTAISLTLNSTKADTTSYSKEALATELEADIPFGEWREFTLSLTDNSDPSKFIGWTKEQIKTYVSANFGTLLDTTELVTEADLENADDYLGMYVIAENGVDFEVQVIEAGITSVGVVNAHDESQGDFALRWKNTTSYKSGINLRYRYRRTGYLNDSSPIVEMMYTDLVNGRSGMTKAEEAALDADVLNGARLRSAKTRNWLARRGGKTDTIWYNGYLRTSTANTLNKHDYARVVFGALDFSYAKKKTKAWKKALGIVLVVAAFLVASFTAGWGSPLVAIAAGATAAAVTATLVSMVMAKNGDYNGAEYMGRWAKVAGIVALVAGIAAVIQGMLRQAAQASVQEAAKQAGQQAATDLLSAGASEVAATAAASAVEASVTASATVADITMEGMLEAGKNMLIQNTVSSPFQAMSTASKVIGPMVEMREKNKAKQLDSLAKEAQAAQAQVADLYDKNLHLGLQDIRMYTKPFNVDNAQFEVDYLYEGTKFEIMRPSFARYGMNIIT